MATLLKIKRDFVKQFHKFIYQKLVLQMYTQVYLFCNFVCYISQKNDGVSQAAFLFVENYVSASCPEVLSSMPVHT